MLPDKLKAWFNRPNPNRECPDCGHYYMVGSLHDKTACEVSKLRKTIERLIDSGSV